MRIGSFLGALTVLVACAPSSGPGVGSGTGADPAGSDMDTPSAASANEPPAVVAENGQTGSAGVGPCVEEYCVGQVQALAERFEQPPYSPTFLASECQPGLAPGQVTTLEQRYSSPHCRCRDQVGQWYDGPVPGPTPPDGVECALRSSRSGFCIWEGKASECTPGDSKACEPVCAELQRRLAEDAKRTFEVRVRFAHCATPDCLGPNCASNENLWRASCSAILEVNGQCYAPDLLRPTREAPRDCAASDRELLFPDAGRLPPDAGPSSTGLGASDAGSAGGG
jgi:hypothetical protein